LGNAHVRNQTEQVPSRELAHSIAANIVGAGKAVAARPAGSATPVIAALYRGALRLAAHIGVTHFLHAAADVRTFEMCARTFALLTPRVATAITAISRTAVIAAFLALA